MAAAIVKRMNLPPGAAAPSPGLKPLGSQGKAISARQVKSTKAGGDEAITRRAQHAFA
jgi:hypothetical protein